MPDSTVDALPKPRASLVPLSRTITFDGTSYQFSTGQVNRLFWQRIVMGDTNCWLWQGKRLPNGYGQFTFSGRQWYSHRVSYELHHGQIPQGLHLDHLCRNRACCNPAHLEAVTCKENVHRSPIALAAINARKTHCDRGHELTGENLVPRASGQRHCRTCARWRQRVIKAKVAGRTPEAEPPKDLTVMLRNSDTCRAGHPWTEASLYLRPNGVRECRICRDQRGRRKETSRG